MVAALAAGGGKIYAGGFFNFMAGQPRLNLAAFVSDEVPSVPGMNRNVPTIAFTLHRTRQGALSWWSSHCPLRAAQRPRCSTCGDVG